VSVEVKCFAVQKDRGEFGDSLGASVSGPMGGLWVKERY